MQARGLQPNVATFNGAIAACASEGQLQEAMLLLEEMQTRHARLSPTFATFRAALAACEQGRLWRQALSLLDVMETRGVDPDVCSYTSAIAACGRAGEVAHAARLFEAEMPSRGLRPRLATHNALLAAYSKAADSAPAIALLARLSAGDDYSDDVGGGDEYGGDDDGGGCVARL